MIGRWSEQRCPSTVHCASLAMNGWAKEIHWELRPSVTLLVLLGGK